MHFLIAAEYTALAGEINALYHEAAVKAGISDSVQNILYVLYEENGRAPQSAIAHRTGISRQTINSAIRKLERDGIVALEPGKGRNTIVCLTEAGQSFAKEKIAPLFSIENQIWSEWTEDEQREYLRLTKKYRDALRRHMKETL